MVLSKMGGGDAVALVEVCSKPIVVGALAVLAEPWINRALCFLGRVVSICTV